jgi:hypothetical protein
MLPSTGKASLQVSQMGAIERWHLVGVAIRGAAGGESDGNPGQWNLIMRVAQGR